jgi:hypothetical protein
LYSVTDFYVLIQCFSFYIFYHEELEKIEVEIIRLWGPNPGKSYTTRHQTVFQFLIPATMVKKESVAIHDTVANLPV